MTLWEVQYEILANQREKMENTPIKLGHCEGYGTTVSGILILFILLPNVFHDGIQEIF